MCKGFYKKKLFLFLFLNFNNDFGMFIGMEYSFINLKKDKNNYRNIFQKILNTFNKNFQSEIVGNTENLDNYIYKDANNYPLSLYFLGKENNNSNTEIFRKFENDIKLISTSNIGIFSEKELEIINSIKNLNINNNDQEIINNNKKIINNIDDFIKKSSNIYKEYYKRQLKKKENPSEINNKFNNNNQKENEEVKQKQNEVIIANINIENIEEENKKQINNFDFFKKEHEKNKNIKKEEIIINEFKECLKQEKIFMKKAENKSLKRLVEYQYNIDNNIDSMSKEEFDNIMENEEKIRSQLMREMQDKVNKAFREMEEKLKKINC